MSFLAPQTLTLKFTWHRSVVLNYRPLPACGLSSGLPDNFQSLHLLLCLPTSHSGPQPFSEPPDLYSAPNFQQCLPSPTAPSSPYSETSRIPYRSTKPSESPNPLHNAISPIDTQPHPEPTVQCMFSLPYFYCAGINLYCWGMEGFRRIYKALVSKRLRNIGRDVNAI